MNVEASILARITKRVKIVLLGNPLPVVGNPLRLAEELGRIDMISDGLCSAKILPVMQRGPRSRTRGEVR